MHPFEVYKPGKSKNGRVDKMTKLSDPEYCHIVRPTRSFFLIFQQAVPRNVDTDFVRHPCFMDAESEMWTVKETGGMLISAEK